MEMHAEADGVRPGDVFVIAVRIQPDAPGVTLYPLPERSRRFLVQLSFPRAAQLGNEQAVCSGKARAQ